MSITIGRYNFEGPYTSTANLKDQGGVYTILCQNNGKYNTVDVGESATVKSRVENHDRKPCWNTNCFSSLAVAVLYTPGLSAEGRRQIEEEVRNQYNFPCGEK